MKVHQITIILVVGLAVFLCLIFGCKDKVEASEPNDYDELVVVIQDLQKMVGKVIDAGNVQNSCIGSLADIDKNILDRIISLERQVQPANSFVSIMLSEDIDIGGEKQGLMTADERLALVRKAFTMMAEHEKIIDPNHLWSNYEIHSVYIEGTEEPNEPEPNEPLWKPSPDKSVDVMITEPNESDKIKIESCKHELIITCGVSGCECNTCLHCRKKFD